MPISFHLLVMLSNAIDSFLYTDKSLLIFFYLAGMKSEGLYRVSGFSEHIEDVRLAFDRGLLTTYFCAPGSRF